MPTLLDDKLVTDALSGLHDWTGDSQRISRTVRLDDPEPALAAINDAADTLNHHPVVEREGDSVTFALWTHSEGGVTELDIALASRIDDLIRRYAEGGPLEETGTNVMEPRFEDASTRAAGAEDAASGEQPWHESGEEPGSGLLHPAANPREGAGPPVAPTDAANTVEPLPSGGETPGMHEPADRER